MKLLKVMFSPITRQSIVVPGFHLTSQFWTGGYTPIDLDHSLKINSEQPPSLPGQFGGIVLGTRISKAAIT